MARPKKPHMVGDTALPDNLYPDPRHRENYWRNHCKALMPFGEDFESIPVHKAKLADLRKWRESLTFHQQHARRAEFNKFFNFLMAEGLCKLESNPFTTADDSPRLLEKGKLIKKHQRLTLEVHWTIYEKTGNKVMKRYRLIWVSAC
ncbi:hypothetical protein ACJJID_01510 [Microbulbifer sp. CnH-101-G]|uniref:hypothetical protein n=1 Tax=Microbulbifer sp. CnH-101-G TaxID=3243393 RepID=UPI0040392626